MGSKVYVFFQSHRQELNPHHASWFFCSPGAPCVPWHLPPHPVRAALSLGSRRLGGRALRAALQGLSDLLTLPGLRPQALPTLVNTQAPLKAVSSM